MIVLQFYDQNGNGIIPISVRIQSEIPPSGAYGVESEWENHVLGARAPNSTAFNARMKVMANSLVIQGNVTSNEIIESIRQYRLLSIITEDETYERFHYQD